MMVAILFASIPDLIFGACATFVARCAARSGLE
jgi:hypothetical protein